MSFKLDMAVDLYVAYVFMLIWITLTLMQGHTGLAEFEGGGGGGGGGGGSPLNYFDN